MDHARTPGAETRHRHHPWRHLARRIQHFFFDDPGFLPTPPARDEGPPR